MDESRHRLTALRDPALPGFESLLGDSAVDLLDAVTRATMRRRTVSAAPAQVTWHPGRSLTVRYRAGLMARGGRKPVADSLVGYAGPDLPEGATILENDGVRVAAWPVAADPALPGLAVALDPARVPAILDGIGAPRGPIRTQLRAYRPLRRAVVEVWAGQMRFFLKVVPPAQIAGLQARHRLMGDLLPVPMSHGWSTDLGLVVLEALPGQTLRDALGDPSAPLPDVRTIAALLDAIPDPGDGARAGSPLSSARSHARLLKRVVPECADDLAAIVARLHDDGPPGDLVPVHGDLHEAQLLVRDGAITGLLDLDTAALGYRIDDWANMLGHLSTWQQVAPDPERVAAYARGLLGLAETQCDPRELRCRIAAMVVGLATGPFRVQMAAWPEETAARIALAARWLESAERAVTDERPLMSASSVPHGAARS